MKDLADRIGASERSPFPNRFADWRPAAPGLSCPGERVSIVASDADTDLEEIAEIVLRRSRREHSGLLDASGGGEGPSSRGRRLADGAVALRRSSDRALAALLGLLRAYGSTASTEWARQRFERHVDEMAAELLGRLARAPARSGPSSAARNRVVNEAAALKTEAGRAIAEQATVFRRRAEDEPLDLSAEERDDRLPLGRRGAFDRNLLQGVRAARESRSPFGLVMIDLDHFKRVNDEHGHAVGDEVLLEVARIVAGCSAGKGRAYRLRGAEPAPPPP